MTEAYTLTGPQLMEVCAQFSAIMGWIKDPYTREWYDEIRGYKTPEGLHDSMSAAIREAVDRVADEDCTSVEVLTRFKAEWEKDHG
jgi:hypothetical protein